MRAVRDRVEKVAWADTKILEVNILHRNVMICRLWSLCEDRPSAVAQTPFSLPVR